MRTKNTKVLRTDTHYLQFLKDIKEKIRNARIHAAHSVNRKLIDLHWKIGQEIVERQEKFGWGKAVVENLAKDLSKEFANNAGFSSQNLWYMRQFYLEYKDYPNLQQLVGEIPWGQNLLVLSKIKDMKAREYYLSATAKCGWSRNVLLNQMKAQAYERQCVNTKQNNFTKALPEHLAEQADEAMKDIYLLGCLGITKPVLEREIENRMISKIKDVILELGYGFCFIGNQYKISLHQKEYFIDLLFYHRKLKCLVAIELKAGVFEPEYAGKMNFYLNLLDDYVREEGENPSIGIILCAGRDRVEVEYALRGIEKPVGVAEYSLTKKLPQELANKLPNPKDLELQILQELGMPKTKRSSSSTSKKIKATKKSSGKRKK